jgi:tetratricopeptide (TPR) repeat protein
VGGCTLEAAEAVCAEKNERDSDTTAILDGLTALVDKSLVRQLAAEEEPRFAMLETIRAYALERLEASGEAEQLRQQHAHYYLAFGETIMPEDHNEDDSTQTVRLDRDYDNLWAALAWSQTMAGDPETALRLSDLLQGLWYYRGAWREALAALERTLHHPRGIGRSDGQLFVHLSLGQFLVLMGRYPAAREHFQQALLLVRGQDNPYQLGWMLERLGWLAREQNDTATATAQLDECLALFRRLDDSNALAQTLNTLAEVAIMEEDPARAEALLAESRSAGQRTPNPKEAGLVWTLNHLGHAAQLRGDYDDAMQFHKESLALFLEHGDNWLHYYALHDMGQIALAQRRLDKATDWLGQALRLSRALDDAARQAWCLAGLGSAAGLDEEPERAARLWGAAERLREALGCRPAPAARATYERALAAARAELGEEAFAAAWAAGGALTLEQAIDEALAPS